MNLEFRLKFRNGIWSQLDSIEQFEGILIYNHIPYKRKDNGAWSIWDAEKEDWFGFPIFTKMVEWLIAERYCEISIKENEND